MNKIKILTLVYLISFPITNKAFESDHEDYCYQDNGFNVIKSSQAKPEMYNFDLETGMLQDFEAEFVFNQYNKIEFCEKTIKHFEKIYFDQNNKFRTYNNQQIECSLDDICLSLKKVYKDLEALKKDQAEYKDLNIVSKIFDHSRRLAFLIYKFKIDQFQEFQNILSTLNKTMQHIRQDMTKLALGKNKTALLFIKENLILGYENFSNLVTQYLQELEDENNK